MICSKAPGRGREERLLHLPEVCQPCPNLLQVDPSLSPSPRWIQVICQLSMHLPSLSFTCVQPRLPPPRLNLIQEPLSIWPAGLSFDLSNPFVAISSKLLLTDQSVSDAVRGLGQQLMTLRFCRRPVIRFSCLHHLQEAGHLLPTHLN